MKKHKNIQWNGIWRQTDRERRRGLAGNRSDFGFYTNEFYSAEIGLDVDGEGKGGGGGGRGLPNSGKTFIRGKHKTFYVLQTNWNTIQPWAQTQSPLTICMCIFMNNNMQSSINERL